MMTKEGLRDSADLLSQCIPLVKGNTSQSGSNPNYNTNAKLTQAGKQLSQVAVVSRSDETIYESAVPNRPSTSSEDELINTSDELELDKTITTELRNIRHGRGGTIQEQARSIERSNVPIYFQTGNAGGAEIVQSQVLADPDIEVGGDQIITAREEAKVRIYSTGGNLKANDRFNQMVSPSALMDEKLIVVGAHLEEAMINKIREGKYVDFSKLIPKDRVMAEEDTRMEMVVRNGRTFVSPVSSVIAITNFNRWEQAFRVFSNICCKANPDRCAELIEYNHVIHTISMAYAWYNVYVFRVRVQTTYGKESTT